MKNDDVDDIVGLYVMLHLPWDVALALSNHVIVFRLADSTLPLIGWQSGLRTFVVLHHKITVGRQ